MSRQIRPPSSIFGWYMGVVKRTFGGSKGYLEGTLEASTEDSSNAQPVMFKHWEWVSIAHLLGTAIPRVNVPSS